MNKEYNTHGGYFSPDFLEINAGGTHEQNPNGGVQLGVDAQGVPNFVEEGEIVYDDYVFSDRLKASESELKEFILPKKYAGKTFAEIADKLSKEAKERPNDFVSNNSLGVMYDRLIAAQDYHKQKAEQAKMKRMLKNLTPDQLMQLGAAAQAGQMQPMPQQPMMPMQGQPQIMPPQMQPQEQPMIAARGGHLRKGNYYGTGDPLSNIVNAGNPIQREYMRMMYQRDPNAYLASEPLPAAGQYVSPRDNTATIYNNDAPSDYGATGVPTEPRYIDITQSGADMLPYPVGDAVQAVQGGLDFIQGRPDLAAWNIGGLLLPNAIAAGARRALKTSERITRAAEKAADAAKKSERKIQTQNLKKDIDAVNDTARKDIKQKSLEISGLEKETRSAIRQGNFKEAKALNAKAQKKVKDLKDYQDRYETTIGKFQGELDKINGTTTTAKNPANKKSKIGKGVMIGTGAAAVVGIPAGIIALNRNKSAYNPYEESIARDLQQQASRKSSGSSKTFDFSNITNPQPVAPIDTTAVAPTIDSTMLARPDSVMTVPVDSTFAAPADSVLLPPIDTTINAAPDSIYRAKGGQIRRGNYYDGLNGSSSYLNTNPYSNLDTFLSPHSEFLPSYGEEFLPYTRNWTPDDVRKVEAEDWYKEFTDFVINNWKSPEVQAYLQNLDKISGKNNTQLGPEYYRRMRNDGKYGYYHLTPNKLPQQAVDTTGDDLSAQKAAYYGSSQYPQNVDSIAALNYKFPQTLQVPQNLSLAGAPKAKPANNQFLKYDLNGSTTNPIFDRVLSANTFEIDPRLKQETPAPTFPANTESASNIQSTYNPYRLGLRGIGIATNGISTLYNMLQDQDEYPFIRYTPETVGGSLALDRLQYNPYDFNLTNNQLNAADAATRSQIANSGMGPSTGAALLAQNYNTGRNLGNSYWQTQLANQQQKANVTAANNQAAQAEADYDYRRNLGNVQIRNNAALTNLNTAITKGYYDNMYETQKWSGVSNQLQNFTKGIADYAREQEDRAMAMANPALYYYWDNIAKAFRLKNSESIPGTPDLT